MLKIITDSSVKQNKFIFLLLILSLCISIIPVSADSAYAESDPTVAAQGTGRDFSEDKDGTDMDDDGDIDDSEPEYIITLNPMKGTVSKTTITVTAGGIYKNLPTPTRKNYVFKGWYTKKTNGTLVTNDDVASPTPTVLYARWEGKAYTVTLDPQRGTLKTKSYKVNYGNKYSVLPVIKRKGLVFMGWYTKKIGGTKVAATDTVKMTKNRKLYAKWAPTWYLQYDKKWAKKWYRVKKEASTIGNAGCGPSTMSMVISSLKNTKVTPAVACKWSRSKGYKAYLSGTKDGYFKAHGRKYGIKVKQIYYGDLRYTKKSKANKYHNQAKKAVKNGNWVIVLAGHGKWTKGSGHFILWYKTEGSYAYIRDANSTASGRAKAKVSTLLKQSKRYWIVNVPKSKKVN